MSIWTRLDRIAADVEKLDKQVKAVSNSPQSQRTSVEGGSIDFNDADGNLMAVVGGQDDGSNTIRHVDGPTPPVPAGLSSHVDGPIIQTTWDGTFEDDEEATFDWSHLEVLAVGPDNEQLRGTINDVTGASVSLAATVSGEWAVYARSVSRAEKRSVDGDAGTVEVKVTDLSGAIEDVQQSANGKNNVTYSESPPTEADEGIVGDTWFVGATDSESGNWNVVAQYQYTVEGWTPVELSHEVIATVDLGKATVGELDGIRIMARTISGDLFTGDAFDGIVFRGNTFVTRDGNGEFSDRGLFFQKPDGTAIFRVPTDGTAISMSASDVRIERAQVDEIELNEGRVRSGGLFELSSGVTPPASPPELNSSWQGHATLPTPTERSDYENLAYWGNGNSWVRAINVFGTGEGDRIEIYDYDTGELTDSFPITIDPRHGVTVMGDTVYIMGKDHNVADPRVFIFGYNLTTGARTSRHEYTRGIQAKNALGNDGTNLIVASVYNRELWVHRRDPVTGVQVGPDMRSGSNSWPATGGKDLYGVRINGNDVEVVTSWGGRVYLNSNNALARKTDSANASGYAGWELPAHDVSGCAWVNGLPYPVDSAGNIYRGTPPSSDSTVRVTYTWWDGTHETTPAPIAEAGVPAQQNFTASVPSRPGLSKRVYCEFSSVPGTWYRATLGESETTATYQSFSGDPRTLPTSNSFPNADPATLKSTNDKFEVKGDGSGHWGHFNVDTNGAMSGMIVTGWAMCYVDDVNNAKKFTIQLPPGRFTRPPVVWASVSTSGPQMCSVGIVRQEISTTEFSLWFHRTSKTETGVTWYAMDDSEA